MGEAAPPVTAPGSALRTLSTGQKLVYASGDHTVNLSLSALALFYLYFLTEVAGLLAVALFGAIAIGHFNWSLHQQIGGMMLSAEADAFLVRVDDKTRIKVLKSAVAGLQATGTENTEK